MFALTLVTPEKTIATNLEIDEVLVPGYKGQLDILPGHAPLMTTLGTGILKYRPKGSATLIPIVVSWGYCQVNPQGVTVLAETAESIAEIDRARAEAAKRAAEQKLLEPIIQPDQIAHWQHKLDRANARLAAVEGEIRSH